jgi:hypothetical protein
VVAEMAGAATSVVEDAEWMIFRRGGSGEDLWTRDGVGEEESRSADWLPGGFGKCRASELRQRMGAGKCVTAQASSTSGDSLQGLQPRSVMVPLPLDVWACH